LYNGKAFGGESSNTPLPALDTGSYASSLAAYAEEGGGIMIFLPREEGQGLVEYALIILFVAIVVVAALLIFGPAVGDLYSRVVTSWPF
jgi:pilus assembly protein Flp/PilA